MPPGRKPKPNHLRLVEGNPGRRPIKREPKVPPLGQPPAHLNEVQLVAWAELVADAPPHVLKNPDKYLIELTVRLLTQSRAAGDVPATLAAQLRACFAELGMTPTARARLSVDDQPKANPFDD